MDSILMECVNNEAPNSDLINAVMELNKIKIDICDHNTKLGEGEIWATYLECHKDFLRELEKLEYDEKMNKATIYKLLTEKAMESHNAGRERMIALVNRVFNIPLEEIKKEIRFHWSEENLLAKMSQLGSTEIDANFLINLIKEKVKANTEKLHDLFHNLWTKATGAANYSKQEWIELERLMKARHYNQENAEREPELFHTLWGKASSTLNYSKQEWIEFQRLWRTMHSGA